MRFVRYEELKARGIVDNRTTLRRRIEAGTFPRPVHLGPNTIAWPSTVIDAYVATLLEQTSEADRERAKAHAMLAHADALEAEGRNGGGA